MEAQKLINFSAVLLASFRSFIMYRDTFINMYYQNIVAVVMQIHSSKL